MNDIKTWVDRSDGSIEDRMQVEITELRATLAAQSVPAKVENDPFFRSIYDRLRAAEEMLCSDKRERDCTTAEDWKRKAQHYEYEWRCCSEFANRRIGELKEELAHPPAQADSTPGWKLVPIIPTMDMVVDGFEATSDFRDSDECEEMSGCQASAEAARVCYRAMLAAAPKGTP